MIANIVDLIRPSAQNFEPTVFAMIFLWNIMNVGLAHLL